jgi:hypothetical protein
MTVLPQVSFTTAGVFSPAANRKEIDDAYPG